MSTTLKPAYPDRSSLERAIESRIRGIVAALDTAGIPYVITRNADYIPSVLVDRGDIDIAIPRNSSELELAEILLPFNVSHMVHHQIVTHSYFSIRSDFQLHVDFLHGATSWLGAEFVPDRLLFESPLCVRDFNVANEQMQSMLMWFQSLLWGGFFKDRYKLAIVSAARKHSKEMQEHLIHALGQRLGSRYVHWLLDETPELSAETVQEARRAVWWIAFKRSPRKTTCGLFDHFVQEVGLRFRFRPSGLVVVILGPDGSGKSTVCDQIEHLPPAALPFGVRHRIHLMKPLLPSPGEIRRGQFRPNRNAGDIVTDPHGSRSHAAPLAIARMGYFLLSAWVSDLFWTRHQIAKNALILQDRHLMELSVDPVRYRYGGPSWMARLIGRLAPQPDLTILLDAPVDVLQARKQEVPPEETARQRLAYRALVQHLPNGHIVDASRPVEEVTAEVQQVIVDHVINRTRRYFRKKGTGTIQ